MYKPLQSSLLCRFVLKSIETFALNCSLVALLTCFGLLCLKRYANFFTQLYFVCLLCPEGVETFALNYI